MEDLANVIARARANMRKDHVLSPDGKNYYIVVKFTKEMAGKPIRDDCVARLQNHKWCRKLIGDKSIRTLSSARYPIYGTYEYCLGSGPVGMSCQNPRCVVQQRKDNVYKVVYYGHGDPMTLDSQWISELMEQHHETAMGDRIADWGLAEPAFRMSNTTLDFEIRVRSEKKFLHGEHEAPGWVDKTTKRFYDGIREAYD